MPTVKAFRIGGLQCIIRTRGEHYPPHFHVLRLGEWEITVDVLTTTEGHLEYTIKRPPKLKKIPATFVDELIRAVVDNREALLIEWKEIFEKIQPEKNHE